MKIYKFNSFIFEKSSLTSIGIPNEVLKQIQIDYELPHNIKWEELTFSNTIKSSLENDDKNLYIEINKEGTKVNVITSIRKNKKKIYILDEYKYNFGWEKSERIDITFAPIVQKMSFKSIYYHCESKNFKLTSKKERSLENINVQYENFNTQFKKDFTNKFISIIKKDKYNLLDNTIKENGLTTFDEYLYDFESQCSEELKRYLTIKELISRYGKDKIFRSFMYFIKTNNLKLFESNTSLKQTISLFVDDYWYAMDELEGVLHDLGYKRMSDSGKDVLFVEKEGETRLYWYGKAFEIKNEPHYKMPEDWATFVKEITQNFEDIKI